MSFYFYLDGPRPTVTPNEEFDDEAAATQLRDAMQGLGTSEDEIINVLTTHSNEQRQIIIEKYKTMYGQDLIEDIKSECRGTLEGAFVALLTPPRKYDAQELHDAISGAGTKEKVLTEILCARTNEEIEEIKEIYQTDFECSLEDDIRSDTTGNLQRLYVSQLTGGRGDPWGVDDDQAMEEAQALFDAGEGSWGTDESEFNRILSTRGMKQLNATFIAYQQLADKDIVDAIEGECAGALEDAYVAIVRFMRRPHFYFAELLKEAMDGAGTNEAVLTRIITSRAEIDLDEIKDCYVTTYGNTLHKDVRDDCGGDFKDLLLTLIGKGPDDE